MGYTESMGHGETIQVGERGLSESGSQCLLAWNGTGNRNCGDHNGKFPAVAQPAGGGRWRQVRVGARKMVRELGKEGVWPRIER